MSVSRFDVADGGSPVDDEHRQGRGDLPPPGELTVMQMLADGYSDPQIARILGISLVTVRRRAQRFCRFLGAKSRLQAMAEAVARGWIKMSPKPRDPTAPPRRT